MLERQRSILVTATFAVFVCAITSANAQSRMQVQEPRVKRNAPANMSDVSRGNTNSPVITNDEDPAQDNGFIDEPIKTSGSDKEPLPHIKKKKADEIDTKFSQQNRYIEHPNAEKGLYYIDKNKVYYYRTKTGEQKYESSVHLGPYEPVNLTNPSHPDLTFDTIYTTHNIPMILYDQEYDISKKFGRLGYKFGSGLYVAQGHGQFTSTAANIAEPKGPREQFSLFVFPFNVGAIYHLDYFKGQWVIPYAEGGADLFAFAELRNDNANKFGAAIGASPLAHASVGATIPLGHNARSFLDLDREYGIKRMGIAIEFRDYIAINKKYDFSGSVISGGISAEY